MKKLSILLTLTMLICLLTACGNAVPSSAPASSESSGAPASSEPAEPAQSTAESTRTDVLYAVFGAEDVKEYPAIQKPPTIWLVR